MSKDIQSIQEFAKAGEKALKGLQNLLNDSKDKLTPEQKSKFDAEVAKASEGLGKVNRNITKMNI